VSLPSLNQPFVIGSIQTAHGLVPRVSTSLHRDDYLGTVMARSGIGRMNYTVDPGLYAVGQPDNRASVLVTANYKMSFDRLRNSLSRRDLWILVLDTRGINVWCAAGKGTFGNAEFVERIKSSGLAQVISHRELILPQLAAPGVSAHQIKKLCGFKVVYGPIRAEDLPVFLDNGLKATPEMRLKTFSLMERIELIPVELIAALKTALFVLPVLFLLGGLGSGLGYWSNVFSHGLFAVLACLGGIIAGAVLTPILLPLLPGRAFSLKGLSIGLITAILLLICRGFQLNTWSNCIGSIAWLLLVPAIAAYLAMNFTGASTYTSLSGVKKEMHIALPLQVASAAAGICLWIASRWI
jgi:hypothetical protein